MRKWFLNHKFAQRCTAPELCSSLGEIRPFWSWTRINSSAEGFGVILVDEAGDKVAGCGAGDDELINKKH